MSSFVFRLFVLLLLSVATTSFLPCDIGACSCPGYQAIFELELESIDGLDDIELVFPGGVSNISAIAYGGRSASLKIFEGTRDEVPYEIDWNAPNSEWVLME